MQMNTSVRRAAALRNQLVCSQKQELSAGSFSLMQFFSYMLSSQVSWEDKHMYILCLFCLGFTFHRDLWLIYIFLKKHLSHAEFMCRPLVTVEDIYFTLTSPPWHVKIESGYDKAQYKPLNQHLYVGVCVCIFVYNICGGFYFLMI